MTNCARSRKHNRASSCSEKCRSSSSGRARNAANRMSAARPVSDRPAIATAPAGRRAIRSNRNNSVRNSRDNHKPSRSHRANAHREGGVADAVVAVVVGAAENVLRSRRASSSNSRSSHARLPHPVRRSDLRRGRTVEAASRSRRAPAVTGSVGDSAGVVAVAAARVVRGAAVGLRRSRLRRLRGKTRSQARCAARSHDS